MKCTYRANTDCRMPKRTSTTSNCQLCLMGQQADEIGLLTSAVMNLSIESALDAIDEQYRKEDDELEERTLENVQLRELKGNL